MDFDTDDALFRWFWIRLGTLGTPLADVRDQRPVSRVEAPDDGAVDGAVEARL